MTKAKKPKATGLSEAECADRCQDRCAGLTDPQSWVLKDLAVASRQTDDGWCTEKQIWPTPSAREFASLKALAAKLLVEIRSTQHGALYRLTADGYARLPPLLRLRTPLPISRHAASPLSFDPQRMAKLKRSADPGTAIAVRAAAAAIVDVASAPAERLSTDERRELKANEQKIERGAHAFLDMGTALREIKIKRLHREKFSTFEAYVWEQWHLERSVAYRLIRFAEIHEQTSAIANKLNLRLTNEAQYRAIEKLTDPKDLAAVLKRAARNLDADPEGNKIPTAKILAQAVREETTSPDDLKREAAEKKRRARELIDQAEREETSPDDIKRVKQWIKDRETERAAFTREPSDFAPNQEAAPSKTPSALQRADSWVTCPTPADFTAAGISDCHVWKDQRPVWAYELNTLRVAIQKLLEERGTEDPIFRVELAWLLTDAGIEARSWEPRPKAKAARRAK
jgi:hypothetical protein